MRSIAERRAGGGGGCAPAFECAWSAWRPGVQGADESVAMLRCSVEIWTCFTIHTVLSIHCSSTFTTYTELTPINTTTTGQCLTQNLTKISTNPQKQQKKKIVNWCWNAKFTNSDYIWSDVIIKLRKIYCDWLYLYDCLLRGWKKILFYPDKYFSNGLIIVLNIILVR